MRIDGGHSGSTAIKRSVHRVRMCWPIVARRRDMTNHRTARLAAYWAAAPCPRSAPTCTRSRIFIYTCHTASHHIICRRSTQLNNIELESCWYQHWQRIPQMAQHACDTPRLIDMISFVCDPDTVKRASMALLVPSRPMAGGYLRGCKALARETYVRGECITRGRDSGA